jgi:hypothetical protein
MKLEQRSHKCVELTGEYVNTFFNPVACCFLYKAKDLSALYTGSKEGHSDPWEGNDLLGDPADTDRTCTCPSLLRCKLPVVGSAYTDVSDCTTFNSWDLPCTVPPAPSILHIFLLTISIIPRFILSPEEGKPPVSRSPIPSKQAQAVTLLTLFGRWSVRISDGTPNILKRPCHSSGG